jgi:hypothetical protein
VESCLPSSTTRAKVQERLRAFLRYCYESELIDRIPKLSPIKVDEAPTLSSDRGPVHETPEGGPPRVPTPKASRVRALIRLMRYSGLAIRDAVTLERNELKWDASAKPWPANMVAMDIATKTGRRLTQDLVQENQALQLCATLTIQLVQNIGQTKARSWSTYSPPVR